ncbi:MAG: hypothetical protein KGL74_07970, partial [Elusimicrobia bacterium]|nr:hypothetical protein [Elusimicrobiota bacterium]
MTPPELNRCPSCQAPHAPDEAFCWMCHRKFWTAPAERPAAPAASKTSEPAPSSVAWTPNVNVPWMQPILIGAFLLLLTGVAVGGGRGTVVLWMGLLPAFFVTALSGFRQPKKMPDSFAGKVEWLLTKVASTVAVM